MHRQWPVQQVRQCLSRQRLALHLWLFQQKFAHMLKTFCCQEQKSLAEGSTADFGESMHTAPSANERLGVKKGTPDSAKWLLPQQ